MNTNDVTRRTSRPLGSLAAALAVSLALLQPVSIFASSAPTARRTTRLQPLASEPARAQEAVAPFGEARVAALKQLYAQLLRGEPFADAEREILEWFAQHDVTALEADVVVSRALSVEQSKRALTDEQRRLLVEYRAWTAANADVLDARRAEMRAAAEAANKLLAPPSNDTCAGAEVVPASGPFPYATAVTNILDATVTGDPPVPSCQTSVSRSVWYTFTPTTSGTYRLSTSGPGSNTNGPVPFIPSPTYTSIADTVMAVYTSTNGCAGPFTEIACADDIAAANNRQAEIASTALTGGTTYYVVVWQFGTTAPTPPATGVQLFVSTTVPPNDTCAGAIALQLNTRYPGTTVGATNDYQLDVASPCFTVGVGQNTTTAPGNDVVYSFTPAATGTYSFRVLSAREPANSSALNPVVYLSATCTPAVPGSPQTVSCLAVANRTSGSPSEEEIKCVSLTGATTYYLFVDTAAALTETFFVQVDACTDESEPNDTTAQANTAVCGQEGSITPGTDVDFYLLGTPQPGSRVFALVSGQGANNNNFDLRVTNPTDTIEYDDANADPPFGTASATVAGTVATGALLYLRINNGSAAANEPYRLYSVVQPPSASATAEVEPNNVTTAATSGANNYFSGALSSSSDVDVFSFTATANDLVFVGLDLDPTRESATSGFNGRLDLLDANGNMLLAVNDAASASSTTSGAGSLTSTTPFAPAESLVFTVPATGTYYVRVTGTVNANPDYLLSISRNCQTGGAPVCTITCPANVTVGNDAGQCGATVTYPAPTTTGTCGTVTCAPASGSVFPVGTTSVTCSTASGPSCSFTVTVNDTQLPTVNCPSNVTVSTPTNQCMATVTFSASASDNCPGVTISCAPPSGTSFPVGTTSVTCTATDASSNQSSCSFNVTVNDTQAPAITCPANVTAPATSPSGAVVTYATPTATDNCPNPTVSCVPASGSTFPIGTTPVTCTATDASSNTTSCMFNVSVVQGGGDTIGVYVNTTNAWFLRNSNTPGNADLTFTFGGSPTLVAITGDWDGNGTSTAGLYEPSTGAFFLKNSNSGGSADIVFTFGGAGLGLVPIVGDWNNDGTDTIGLYNPATGAFFLKNTNAGGDADIVFTFGAGGGGLTPLSGDWNADGTDTIGLYAPATGAFFLKNTNAGGDADIVFTFGAGGAGIVPVTGDWNADLTDSIGLYAASTGTFFLKDTNAGGNADNAFSFGPANVKPLAGNWDGM